VALTLEEVREALRADLLDLPFHRLLGVEIDPGASAKPHVSIPAKPETSGPGGQQSPAAIFTLGEAACTVEMCEAIAPRAVELGMGAIFLTTAAEFRIHRPARGTIEASTSLVEGLEEEGGSKPLKKATVVAEARIIDESGELAAEQEFSFYVRFMSEDMMGELLPTTHIGRLVGS
jgi:hypothetical protein